MNVSNENRLTTILEGTGAGTWEWNVDTGELIINDRWADMLGYSCGELEPISINTWKRLTHPQDRKNALAKIRKVLSKICNNYDSLLRMKHKDGSWRYIHARGMLLTDPDLDGCWVVGTHIDVSDQKVTQLRLSQLTESLPGIIYTFVMEADGKYYFPYISRKTQDFYGFPPEVGIHNPDRVFSVIHPDDIEAVKASIAYSYKSLEEWACDYRVTVGGRSRWMRGIAQPEGDNDGTVTWHGMVINIDEQKRLEEELQKLSVTDELTGIYNRRFVLRELEAQLAKYERYGHPFALVSLDIDHFKSVNDTYGHLVGDEVLKTFAGIVGKRIRATDFFARTGGEEFLILMPHTDVLDAYSVAEMLRETFEGYCFKTAQGQSINITISAGVVGSSEQIVSGVESLLTLCDQSLYKAKRAGRNKSIINKS